MSEESKPINLGQLIDPGNHKYELSVSNEAPEDAVARRTAEAADAELKRKMTFSLLCFVNSRCCLCGLYLHLRYRRGGRQEMGIRNC